MPNFKLRKTLFFKSYGDAIFIPGLRGLGTALTILPICSKYLASHVFGSLSDDFAVFFEAILEYKSFLNFLHITWLLF